MGTQGEQRTRAAGEMVRQSGDVRVGSDALRTQLLSKIRIELDAAQSRLARARARHRGTAHTTLDRRRSLFV